jgi:uncharacterized protein (TIGR03067 family)
MSWQLAIVTLVCSLAADAADEAAQAEIAKWQGAWQAVSMETDGKMATPEQLEKIKLMVTGADYHFRNGAFSEHGTYRFHPNARPKQLDIVVGDGADKGKVYLVIYKIEPDELTICLEKNNKNRPSEFTGKAGSGCVLEVWKRVKP